MPDELLEAARIDGASEARIFFTIVLRLLAPAMVTIFLFLFVATWNNFLLPLMMVYLRQDARKPVTLGLYGMVSLATFTDRGALMMGALLGVLPVDRALPRPPALLAVRPGRRRPSRADSL